MAEIVRTHTRTHIHTHTYIFFIPLYGSIRLATLIYLPFDHFLHSVHLLLFIFKGLCYDARHRFLCVIFIFIRFKFRVRTFRVRLVRWIAILPKERYLVEISRPYVHVRSRKLGYVLRRGNDLGCSFIAKCHWHLSISYGVTKYIQPEDEGSYIRVRPFSTYRAIVIFDRAYLLSASHSNAISVTPLTVSRG